jgi:hypothetical protein
MAVALALRDDLTLCAGFVWDVSEKGIGRMEARARARQARANAHLLRTGEKILEWVLCRLQQMARSAL